MLPLPRSLILSLTMLTIVAALVAAYFMVQEPSGDQASKLSVGVDFDAHNGELGELQTEVRIDSAEPITVTSRCAVRAPNTSPVCQVRLPLAPGRRMVSLRLSTAKGWTPWSQATPLEVK